MAYLYTNANGFRVTTHSHSGGMDWWKCHEYYRLKRKEGWRERKDSAAMMFGRCVEAAITARCLGSADPYEAVEREWRKFSAEMPFPENATDAQKAETEKQRKRNAEMSYSVVEKDWDRMLWMGREMVRMFDAMLPSLPIVRPKFQQKIEPELFPNTKLAGIRFTGYLDIISSPPADHPALTKVEGWEKPFRPLIVDVKVSGKRLPEDLIMLDLQLKKYAWLSGVRDVALLNFVKGSPEIKRGTKVMPLKPPTIGEKDFASGDHLLCAEPEGDGWWLLTEEAYRARSEYASGLKGKAADAKKAEFTRNAGVLAQPDDFTTLDLQFLPTRLSEDDIADVARLVSSEVVEIANAEQTGVWAKTGGIRFPQQQCPSCPMRGICSRQPALRDELLTREGEEWLEDAA